MSAKHKKLVLVVCLLSGVLLCILGCNAIPSIKTVLTPDPNRFPVKSWNITMDLDQREEFFTQLQNFADKHSLELRSTFHDADKKSFIIVFDGDGTRNFTKLPFFGGGQPASLPVPVNVPLHHVTVYHRSALYWQDWYKAELEIQQKYANVTKIPSPQTLALWALREE